MQSSLNVSKIVYDASWPKPAPLTQYYSNPPKTTPTSIQNVQINLQRLHLPKIPGYLPPQSLNWPRSPLVTRKRGERTSIHNLPDITTIPIPQTLPYLQHPCQYLNRKYNKPKSNLNTSNYRNTNLTTTATNNPNANPIQPPPPSPSLPPQTHRPKQNYSKQKPLQHSCVCCENG